jgi:GNAT superfamily N-acetyltransferase
VRHQVGPARKVAEGARATGAFDEILLGHGETVPGYASNVALEFRRAEPGLAAALGSFLRELAAGGDEEQFHPHPLDDAAAREVCDYAGADVYLVGLEGDAGFAVPSVGIAVRASARGRGIGRALMGRLHEEAAARGAARVRLRAHPDNLAALRLYRSLGYGFDGEEEGQLVGILELRSRP